MSHACRPVRRARASLGALLCVLPLPACTNDLDELFCDPDCPPPEAGDVQPAPLPFTPDRTAIPACTDCADTQCGDQRAACLADEACSEVLGCMGPCEHPACIMECWAKSGEEQFSEAGWASYDELAGCVQDACSIECQWQQNWECAGKFDWPTAEGDSIDVDVRFAPDGTEGGKSQLAGAMARACGWAGCGNRGVWVRLDARNGGQFELSTNDRSGRFTGYFEVESDEIGPLGTHHRIHYWPLWQDLQFNVDLIPDHINIVNGWRPSPSAATVWIITTDCLFAPSARLHVRLLDLPDVPIGIATATDVSFQLQETRDAAVFIPEVHIEDELLEVVVQGFYGGDPETPEQGKLVSERRIELRAGWLTTLYVAPDSRNGL